MKAHTIDIITLGCSKNLVDSERLIRQLELSGYRVTHDSDNPQGEIAVINTCGFIGDAKEESIQMILSMAQRKQQGRLRRLYVMGCLSQRYLSELTSEIPEVDKFYGKFNWTELLTDLGHTFQSSHSCERRLTTPSHYAYLKISEGCDRHCAYCAIPLITGHHQSRPMEEILSEVRALVSVGVKEFQVIAQELTYYGLDLYGRRALPELIQRISDIQGVQWIRLHYAYPTDFPVELLSVMRDRPNVCKYLDLAFQHIADPVLSAMHRHITSQQTYDLIQTIRSQVPGIHLRTTLMVGFPGETEQDYQQLLEFVRRVRFERLGAFAYSEEEGTWSASHLTDDVPQAVKQTRLSKLMRLQQGISAAVQEEKVGHVFTTIIDRVEGDYFIGRTQFDSPEVDPEMLIPRQGQPLCVGEFYQIQVDSADDFDLYGHPVQSISIKN